MQSGLYAALADAQLLIPHREVATQDPAVEDAYKVLRPDPVPDISYPYEWSFSQLKDAALATLKIQTVALAHGMSLKDSSAYNVQFLSGQPILIDTLSFEKLREGMPWVAYRQFCQHFLAPLALMSYVDVRLNQLLRVFLDGIPLDLASRLLPFRARFSVSIWAHLLLHAGFQRRYADRQAPARPHRLSREALAGLIDHLTAAVRKISWRPAKTEWRDYYQETNYSSSAFEHKKQVVAAFLAAIRPEKVWDFGANTGVFSHLAVEQGCTVVAWDGDPAAVELLYLQNKKQAGPRSLPLLLDLCNPSSSIGWQHQERMSLKERGPADLGLALALVHHLAIGNNLPLEKIAEFFHDTCRALVIEFVPKQDSQVQRLLANREDIFDGYTRAGFERAFQRYFTVLETVNLKESERVVYLMRRQPEAGS